jgi:hypothetical protein
MVDSVGKIPTTTTSAIERRSKTQMMGLISAFSPSSMSYRKNEWKSAIATSKYQPHTSNKHSKHSKQANQSTNFIHESTNIQRAETTKQKLAYVLKASVAEASSVGYVRRVSNATKAS